MGVDLAKVDLAKVDLVCANRPCDNRCPFPFFLKVEKKREGFVNANRILQ